jgi:hypothetical protein
MLKFINATNFTWVGDGSMLQRLLVLNGKKKTRSTIALGMRSVPLLGATHPDRQLCVAAAILIMHKG